MNVKTIPFPVQRALRKLGENICEARRRRRIPTQLLAERAGISRGTLNKIEKGDQGVSFGAYARILFVLGLIDRLAQLVDPSIDLIGLTLEAESLPKRIRIPRKEYGEN